MVQVLTMDNGLARVADGGDAPKAGLQNLLGCHPGAVQKRVKALTGSRKGGRFHLRTAAEVDRQGLRSVGRTARSPVRSPRGEPRSPLRSPRGGDRGSPPPPPGDWRGRGPEPPAPPPPRSRRADSTLEHRRRSSRSRSRDDMCRPKSAGPRMPLLRPKSAAKPGLRY
ncbi:unnamed protein product [Durusdinium trenchii]|uniref:Uncharacterized protein n=1 Tax=Durusdinium trenchii TaxID=1381693 RepID=A0ABP0RU85_9DINO